MAKGKSGISIKLSGFDEMLDSLKAMGADVDKAAKKAIRASAPIVKNNLAAECRSAGVPDHLISKIKIKYTDELNTHKAEIGWEKGSTDPRKPDDTYKVVLLNYGTPDRKTQKGYNRGYLSQPKTKSHPARIRQGAKVTPGFIQKAKTKSNRQIKKEQQKVFDDIVRDFKGGGK